MRERAILERIKGGDRTIKEMVEAIYRDTDPRLHGAAGLSVLAHLEDLVARGLVSTDGDPSIGRHLSTASPHRLAPRPAGAAHYGFGGRDFLGTTVR